MLTAEGKKKLATNTGKVQSANCDSVLKAPGRGAISKKTGLGKVAKNRADKIWGREGRDQLG